VADAAVSGRQEFGEPDENHFEFFVDGFLVFSRDGERIDIILIKAMQEKDGMVGFHKE